MNAHGDCCLIEQSELEFLCVKCQLNFDIRIGMNVVCCVDTINQIAALPIPVQYSNE